MGRRPFDCSAITANDYPGIQLRASSAIKYPPAPSDTTGARILPDLYVVFLWFSKARNCHELVILRD